MAAHLDAATHRLLTDLRDYDRSGNWSQQGFPDCARWLSWRVGWATGTARDHLRVAQRLGDLPLIDDALRTGSISYSKVRAMTRVATVANEAMLLEDARHATGQQLELICRKYATVVRAAKAADEDDDRQRRTVSRRDLDDGMVRIEATLHPEEAALVWAALDRIADERCKARSEELAPAATTDAQIGTDGNDAAQGSDADVDVDVDVAPAAAPHGGFDVAPCTVAPRWVRRRPCTVAPRSFQPRRCVDRHGAGGRARRFAAALTDRVGRHGCRGGAWGHAAAACVSAGASPAQSSVVHRTPGSAEPGSPPVAVFADSTAASATAHAPLAVSSDGTCVSAETARRLACDCGIVIMTEGASGNALSVGRKTRSIPVSIARALLKRDPCCRFPGCGNRVYLEGHHIEHWADGGETALDRLVNLCGFHHRFVHEYRYSVVLDAAQHPRFFDPQGSEVLDVPERPTPERLGWTAVVDRNAALAIDSTTNECLWDGDPPDYVDIIDALVRVDGLQ